MKLRTAFRTALAAAKANILPGLLLQALMLVFFAAYISHEGTRQTLANVANLKQEVGFIFAFFSYVISAALLPEVLKIGFFQDCRIRKLNIYNFLTGAPAWGLMGILVDVFYRAQSVWFGANNDFTTIALNWRSISSFSVPFCPSRWPWAFSDGEMPDSPRRPFGRS